MMLKKIVLSLFVLAVLSFAVPSRAVVIHHCDYTPDIHDDPVHDYHEDMNGCSNFDESEEGVEGTCDYSNAFYWTQMYCTENGCEVWGTIDCNGAKRSYSHTCFGNNAKGFAGRESSACFAETPGGGGVASVCSCEDFSGCNSSV